MGNLAAKFDPHADLDSPVELDAHPRPTAALHRPEAAFTLSARGDGTQRLLQIERVAAGKLTLMIETFPPGQLRYLSPTEEMGDTAALAPRPLPTAELAVFRATHDRQRTADPAVEACLRLFHTLRLEAERRPPVARPPPALNRWTAQWVADTSVEGRRKLDREARRKLVESLTRSKISKDDEALMERMRRLEHLGNAVLAHFAPVVDHVHGAVHCLDERLLDALGKPTTTVYILPRTAQEFMPEVVQTASRIKLEWERLKQKRFSTDTRSRSQTASPDLATLNAEDEGDGVQALSDAFAADIHAAANGIQSAATAVLRVMAASAIYALNPPFSLTHLSSLCARAMCRIALNVTEAEMRIALLRLVFDALLLGLLVRTPGIAALWVDASITKLAQASPHKDVLSALAIDLAAIDLCLLKLTTQHMQDPLPSPHPATIHRLTHLQQRCRMPGCHTPFLGPETLGHSTSWATTVVLQPTVFPPCPAAPEDDFNPPFPALAGIYTLTMYQPSAEVTTALARYLELVHADEDGPNRWERARTAVFTTICAGHDDFHSAPEYVLDIE